MADPIDPISKSLGERPELIVSSARAAPMIAEPADGLFGVEGTGQGQAASFLNRKITLSVLWRFKWLAVGVALAIALPGIVGSWLLHEDEYEAVALVEVQPKRTKILYTVDDNAAPYYRQYVSSLSAMLKSAAVIERVLEDEEVKRTRWFSEEPTVLWGSPPSRIERLRSGLKTTAGGMNWFIEVKLTAPRSRDAALICNKIVAEFLEFHDEQSRKTDSPEFKELTARYQEWENEVKGRQEGIDALWEATLTAMPDELLAQKRARLDNMQAELYNIVYQIKKTEWQLDYYRQRAASQPTSDGSTQTAVTATSHPAQPPYELDADWRQRRLACVTKQNDIDIDHARFGDEHPVMKRHTMELVQAQDLQKLREQELNAQWRNNPGPLLGQARSGGGVSADAPTLVEQLASLTNERTLKTADILAERDEVVALSGKARELAKQQNELVFFKNQLESARVRRFQIEVEDDAPASIRVMSKAFPPGQPSNAKKPLLLTVMFIAGGLACGLAAAYLRATTIPAIQHVADIEQSVQAPFLGYVPLARRGRGGLEELDQALVAECIRMVRTALLQRIDEHGGSAIQITSAGAGAGKTTVAMMLADSLARCGKRILLVDADLRNPSVFVKCGLQLEPGLLGVLRAQTDDAHAICPANDSGVSILPAGKLTDMRDAELLANGVLSKCLKRWRSQYDLVIFDSAPLLPVADARILARQVDGNVLVVREEHCRREEVADALAHLRAAGGNLLGVVFFSGRRSARYSGAYYGYGYYHPGATPAEGAAGQGMDARADG